PFTAIANSFGGGVARVVPVPVGVVPAMPSVVVPPVVVLVGVSEPAVIVVVPVLVVVVANGLLPEALTNEASVPVVVPVPMPLVAAPTAAPTLPTGTRSEVAMPMPFSGLSISSGSWCVVPPPSTKSASALKIAPAVCAEAVSGRGVDRDHA